MRDDTIYQFDLTGHRLQIIFGIRRIASSATLAFLCAVSLLVPFAAQSSAQNFSRDGFKKNIENARRHGRRQRELYKTLRERSEDIAAGRPAKGKLPAVKSIGFSDEDADQYMPAIAEIKELQSLALGRSGVTDKGVQYLPGETRLQELNLRFTAITDAALEKFGAMGSLKKLNLSNTSITDKGLVPLMGLTHLQYLNLTNTAVTDNGLIALKDMRLNRLILPQEAMTDVGLKNYLDALDLQRTFLDFSNWNITDNSIMHVVKFIEINRLALDNTKITDQGLAQINQLGNLVDLDLAGTLITDEGMRSLAQLKSLERLDISRTMITDSGLRLLRDLPKLKMIDVSITKVTQDGAEEFKNIRKDVTVKQNIPAVARSNKQASDTQIADNKLRQVIWLIVLVAVAVVGGAIFFRMKQRADHGGYR